MRSLYTGWTGLATHQRSLDNTGNNLANTNTTGYKKGDFKFSNLLSQVLSGPYPSDGIRGSVAGKAVGAGVTTGAITNNFTAGPMEQTGNPLDVAISGNGFFMVNTTTGPALTRNGSFYLDHTVSARERMLCAGDGMAVQGWMANDGVISPSATTENIYLPALGDHLPGNTTQTAVINGILPPSASGVDFSGTSTRNCDLKGNLDPNGANAIRTSIYAPVTRIENGVAVAANELQEIPVEISFAGPVLSADGTTTTWNWSMRTVDWPRAGDPAVQVYPPVGVSDFPQEKLNFYANADPARNRGAGEIFDPLQLAPGSSSVQSTVPLSGGGDLEASFALGGSFRMDFSRLTTLQNPPAGSELEAWYVDGNAAGSMARTVTVYDDVTRFEKVTNPDGTSSMQAVRRTEARQNLLEFSKVSASNTGSVWNWRSSMDGAHGELTFNTLGDLTAQTSSGGSVQYNFNDMRTIADAASVTLVQQDGYPDGYLEDLSIDQYGKVFGHYSNHVVEPLAQIAVATVPNITGLAGASGTLFYTTQASGAIMIGVAGDGEYINSPLPAIGAGKLVSQFLEGSNVDMGLEFTNLISTERGYQANARVVTTSDEMLKELVALKR